MKRIAQICILILLLLLLACSKKPKYTGSFFQTFNEYSMIGEGNIPKINDLKIFVTVYKNQDSIIVTNYNLLQKGNVKKNIYLKKEGYWFSERITLPSDGCVGVLHELKFIIKDTIYKMQYYKDKNEIFFKSIYLETTTNIKEIDFHENSSRIVENFNEIRNIFKKFSSYTLENSKEDNNDMISFLSKVIKGNRLFVYEEKYKDNSRYRCLTNVYELSPLGEYDLSSAEIVTAQYCDKEGRLPCN